MVPDKSSSYLVCNFINRNRNPHNGLLCSSNRHTKLLNIFWSLFTYGSCWCSWGTVGKRFESYSGLSLFALSPKMCVSLRTTIKARFKLLVWVVCWTFHFHSRRMFSPNCQKKTKNNKKPVSPMRFNLSVCDTFLSVSVLFCLSWGSREVELSVWLSSED